ncbi:hypothetical protein FA13DRAFT_1624980, partial [Coprinellus micaceus]
MTSPRDPSLHPTIGFDPLSILDRVFSRSNPRIKLGTVDLSCSFVVVDIRHHNHPIIYFSPHFTKLTGYRKEEVLGRNCRFLQSPASQMVSMGQRPNSVSDCAAFYLKNHVAADKECQTIITNYRKDGTEFRNQVTIIPL